MPYALCCPAQQRDACHRLLLEQFNQHKEGEVDAAWRDAYADAEELIRCSKSVQNDEETPVMFQQKWERSVVKPAEAFCAQMKLLQMSWSPLCQSLGQFEKECLTPSMDTEYFDATQSILSKVIHDHYRGLLQLQVFQYWHRALYDMCLTHLSEENVLMLRGTKWWRCDAATMFFDRKAAVTQMSKIVDRYAKFKSRTTGFRCKIEEAEAELSKRRVARPPSLTDMWLFGTCCGIVVSMGSILLFVLFFSNPHPAYNPDVHLWGVLPYFRGYLLIYLTIWCWAGAVYHMETYRINYPYLLGLVGSTIGAIQIAKIAAFLTALWTFCFTFYIASAKCALDFLPFVDNRWYILVNAVGPVLFLMMPGGCFEGNTRSWFLKTILQVFSTPFIPVTFAANFLTDYLTSMVKPLLDIITTWEAIFSGTILSESQVASKPVLTPVVILLPLLWRLMQCLSKSFSVFAPVQVVPQVCLGGRPHPLIGRWKISGASTTLTITVTESKQLTLQIHDDSYVLVRETDRHYSCLVGGTCERELALSVLSNSELAVTYVKSRTPLETVTKTAKKCVPKAFIVWPHGMNALKYVVSLLPVILTLLSDLSQNVYVFLLLVSTCYSFLWDVFMDWGLWKNDTFPGKDLVPWYFGLVWRRTSSGTVDTGHKVFYYTLVGCNFIGRCAWAVTLVSDLHLVGISSLGNAELVILLASLVEVLRRSIWARLRLGHEQVADVGNYRHGDGYRDVPPLISKKTPWTTPKGFTVLQKLKIGSTEFAEHLEKQQEKTY
eukprot:TRINITY_DN2074_c7_g1_i1.p1 TRINITY_DN2074_c7_g1~~TRINITY_DN2074_c7_g1_i1.p1  ORF type:complete len:799 (+),score=94.14 TRINITY_DN2074_c7_g1_i1:75-2399(+)